MIAYLQGKVQKKMVKNLILQAESVGYLVFATARLLEKVTEGQMLEVFVHTRVLQDDISLFGFETFGELEFFKMLLNVNGVGAKTALEILSQNIEKVQVALVNGDVAFLSTIPGIGKKTAERLIVELKNKVSLENIDRVHTALEKPVSEDAIGAIMSLGYQRFEIARVLKNIPENVTTVEEMVTFFLRNV